MKPQASPAAVAPGELAEAGARGGHQIATEGSLGEALVALGFVSRGWLDAAIAEAHAQGATPERVLLDARVVSGRQVVEAARHRWGLDPLTGSGTTLAAAVPPAPFVLPAEEDLAPAPAAKRVALARALRVLSTASATAAAIVAAEIAVTLAWQEPLSALVAQSNQRALERQLADLSELDRALARVRTPLLRELAAVTAARLEVGDAVGRIELPALGSSYAVVEGVDEGSLRMGPGHFPDTSLPGEGGTVAVAGHRTTYLAPFRDLDDLSKGDRLVVRMPYGNFTYAVEGTRVVDPNDYWVTRPVGYERLVLTACHPLFSAARRIVVFARRTDAHSPPPRSG